MFTALEAFVPYRVGKGDEVPLLAPVGLALGPWLAGIADVLYEVRLRTGESLLNLPFVVLLDTVSGLSYSRNLGCGCCPSEKTSPSNRWRRSLCLRGSANRGATASPGAWTIST